MPSVLSLLSFLLLMVGSACMKKQPTAEGDVKAEGFIKAKKKTSGELAEEISSFFQGQTPRIKEVSPARLSQVVRTIRSRTVLLRDERHHGSGFVLGTVGKGRFAAIVTAAHVVLDLASMLVNQISIFHKLNAPQTTKLCSSKWFHKLKSEFAEACGLLHAITGHSR
jgi:hypothetical protein